MRAMKLTGTLLKLDSGDYNNTLSLDGSCSVEAPFDNLTVLHMETSMAESSLSAPTSLPPQPSGSVCSICADVATGKHYGAFSCDGCKGFFRRSVRKKHAYTCRFSRQCVVDKDKRNQCRCCRLRKCFRAGMRKEALRCRQRLNDPCVLLEEAVQKVCSAVQNERDCISSYRAEGQTVGTLSINVLLHAEATVHQFPAMALPMICDINAKKIACVGDVFESMKQQLLLLVEWAKCIPEFCSLPIDDRVSLLRAHSAEHLILGVARRSLPYNNLILLGNDFVIPVRGAELEVSRVAVRVQEELVRPLRDLDITDKEVACLRTIVFFDPDCPGLQNPQTVRHLRFQAQMLLDEATCEQRGRFGELLLMLPPLQSVAWQMVETLQLARLLGDARIDSLLQEMLLGEEATMERHALPTGSNRDVLTVPLPPDNSLTQDQLLGLTVPLPPVNSLTQDQLLGLQGLPSNFTSVILPVPIALQVACQQVPTQTGTEVYRRSEGASVPTACQWHPSTFASQRRDKNSS